MPAIEYASIFDWSVSHPARPWLNACSGVSTYLLFFNLGNLCFLRSTCTTFILWFHMRGYNCLLLSTSHLSSFILCMHFGCRISARSSFFILADCQMLPSRASSAHFRVCAHYWRCQQLHPSHPSHAAWEAISRNMQRMKGRHWKKKTGRAQCGSKRGFGERVSARAKERERLGEEEKEEDACFGHQLMLTCAHARTHACTNTNSCSRTLVDVWKFTFFGPNECRYRTNNHLLKPKWVLSSERTHCCDHMVWL